MLGVEQRGWSRVLLSRSTGRTVLHSIKLKNLIEYRMNGEKCNFNSPCDFKVAQTSPKVCVSDCWDLLGSSQRVPPPAAWGLINRRRCPPVLCQDFFSSFLSLLLWQRMWGWTAIFYIFPLLAAKGGCVAELAAHPKYCALHLPGALTSHRFQQSQA